MKEFLLLTGATGLVGTYLLRDLQLAGHRVAVLVRPTKRLSAARRIEHLLAQWEIRGCYGLPFPHMIEGDINLPGLGISNSNKRWLREQCRSVVHSAASVLFRSLPNGEPTQTNLHGTNELLRMCQQLGIGEFHFVSTAYVCGLRSGTVYENELNSGQEFRNDYERSKAGAESLLHAADFLESLTVYRPPFIAGDSRTGFTTSYHGLLHYLRLMSFLVATTEPGLDGVRRVPIRIPCTGQEKRNCVPIDWVSAVIARLFSSPNAHGRTFHLAGNHRITPAQIIEFASSYFNSTGVCFGHSPQHNPSELELLAESYLTVYREYQNVDADFDTKNLQAHASDIICPSLDEEMLHRYIRFGEANHWGKRPSTEGRGLSLTSGPTSTVQI
ncbi:MAG: SDR family oxidoreductase [Planctomycetota bacterium]|nr:SDR family oxidoreductase [Planctomycetota bacterium]MDA1178003.1 SDR family oxidoreductase [Planctomycetota bacterium]